VRLNRDNPKDGEAAFLDIQKTVGERLGEGHFLGVTLQPMVSLKGYEIILGSSTDPQFGPVILFGAGGVLVEVFKDRAIGLPPLRNILGRRIVERTKISTVLKGFRDHPPMDLTTLDGLLVRFSWLIAEQRRILEFDINPLMANPYGNPPFLALDARCVLANPSIPDDELPTLAIRPYPDNYTWSHTTALGQPYTIRPIRPEDVPKVRRFHETLSEKSVNLRYLSPILLQERIRQERLIRTCFIDYDKEIALVADTQEGQTIAIGRLRKFPLGSEASFSLLITDSYQRQGIGAALLRRMIEVARLEGMKRVLAVMSPENEAMRKLLERAGFRLRMLRKKAGLIEGELTLKP
jgi:acetyltransferase